MLSEKGYSRAMFSKRFCVLTRRIQVLKRSVTLSSHHMFVLDFNHAQTPANTFPTEPQFMLFELL